MELTINKTANLLKEQDNILIISHKSPDGDTIGSALALCLALQELGKTVFFACSDDIPKKFDYLTKNVIEQLYLNEGNNPSFVVSVDIAAKSLFGLRLNHFADKVDLCIDHHAFNEDFATYRYLDDTASACGEIIYSLILELGIEISSHMATCLYTAISTDTGCFMYPNTTSKTHRIAADLIDKQANKNLSNLINFDTTDMKKLNLLRICINKIDEYLDGKLYMLTVTDTMLEHSGADASCLDEIIPLPRKIEGALCGIVLRERVGGGLKGSVRTLDPINAARICSFFGGGGHKNAAGFVLEEDEMVNYRDKIVAVVKEEIDLAGDLANVR